MTPYPRVFMNHAGELVEIDMHAGPCGLIAEITTRGSIDYINAESKLFEVFLSKLTDLGEL